VFAPFAVASVAAAGLHGFEMVRAARVVEEERGVDADAAVDGVFVGREGCACCGCEVSCGAGFAGGAFEEEAGWVRVGSVSAGLSRRESVAG